jgi:chromatin segregation and condensation protein Rec8/ScpA/Scc1 (kleisin family)
MKEEVDLLEVPLVDVITAYLDDMESAGVLGYWEDMTEFLLLMSLLVEVKSRLLLPGAYMMLEEELTPEEARDQLLARLFEYSKFRGGLSARGRSRHRRVAAASSGRSGPSPTGANRGTRRHRGRHGPAGLPVAPRGAKG